MNNEKYIMSNERAVLEISCVDSSITEESVKENLHR